MGTYERTHPWITFAIDLRRASQALWVALGECQSKCEEIAEVPLTRDTAELLHQVYLAKGVHATTAIEGNTLSEEQVRGLIEGELRLPRSQSYLEQEVGNIITECNRLVESVRQGKKLPLSIASLETFNAAVLHKLDLDDGVVPGKIRTGEVSVGRYHGAPAKDCKHLLDRLCEWLNGSTFAAPERMGTVYAIIRAVLAHLYIAWIHPFDDGNGRTARLVELQILIASGVPAPAAQLLSNHYNMTRREYYRQLDQASRSGGDVVPFLSYAVEGMLDGLCEQLKWIRYQTRDVAWRDYVHQHPTFAGKSSPGSARRRRLVLDLSEQRGHTPFRDMRELSPKLSIMYADKTDTTIKRDLNELCKTELIEKTDKGYRARRELILAFLPARSAALDRDADG